MMSYLYCGLTYLAQNFIALKISKLEIWFWIVWRQYSLVFTIMKGWYKNLSIILCINLSASALLRWWLGRFLLFDFGNSSRTALALTTLKDWFGQCAKKLLVFGYWFMKYHLDLKTFLTCFSPWPGLIRASWSRLNCTQIQKLLN